MSDLKAGLTEAERVQVDALLAGTFETKQAEQFQAGEFIQVGGSIRLRSGNWLKRGVYQVMRWHADHLEVMRYKERKRMEVPHGLTLTKYPMALVVLSERAAARLIVDGEAVA